MMVALNRPFSRRSLSATGFARAHGQSACGRFVNTTRPQWPHSIPCGRRGSARRPSKPCISNPNREGASPPTRRQYELFANVEGTGPERSRKGCWYGNGTGVERSLFHADDQSSTHGTISHPLVLQEALRYRRGAARLPFCFCARSTLRRRGKEKHHTSGAVTSHYAHTVASPYISTSTGANRLTFHVAMCVVIDFIGISLHGNVKFVSNRVKFVSKPRESRWG
jgi:hypothetical protein